MCAICGTNDNFVMDQKAVIEHATEPWHRQRAKEKEEVEWDAWKAGVKAWMGDAQKVGDRVDVPPELSLARWLPDDERDWEEVEAEKKEWISKWINEVKAAMLHGINHKPRQ